MTEPLLVKSGTNYDWIKVTDVLYSLDFLVESGKDWAHRFLVMEFPDRPITRLVAPNYSERDEISATFSMIKLNGHKPEFRAEFYHRIYRYGQSFQNKEQRIWAAEQFKDLILTYLKIPNEHFQEIFTNSNLPYTHREAIGPIIK